MDLIRRYTIQCAIVSLILMLGLECWKRSIDDHPRMGHVRDLVKRLDFSAARRYILSRRETLGATVTYLYTMHFPPSAPDWLNHGYAGEKEQAMESATKLNLDPQFCGVYVISLRKRKDRHVSVAKELERARIPCPHYLVQAVDLTSQHRGFVDEFGLRYELYKNWTLDPTAEDYVEPRIHGREVENMYYSRPMTTGEVGCAISHHRIWVDAYLRGLEHVIIFEDDVIFELPSSATSDRRNTAMFDLVDELPSGWDMLYIGRDPIDDTLPHASRLSLHLTVPTFSYCLFGYVLSTSGIKKLVEMSEFRRHLMPVDEFVPSLYADSPREDIQNLVNSLRIPSLRTYALLPDRARQIGAEAGSDTEDSDYYNRFDV